jgi:hypothetical protein
MPSGGVVEGSKGHALVEKRHKQTRAWKKKANKSSALSGGLQGRELASYTAGLAKTAGILNPSATKLGQLMLALNHKACITRRLRSTVKKVDGDLVGAELDNSRLHQDDGQGFAAAQTAFADFRTRFFEQQLTRRNVLQPFVTIEPGDGKGDERWTTAVIFYAGDRLLCSVQFSLPLEFVSKRSPHLVQLVRDQMERFRTGDYDIHEIDEFMLQASFYETFMLKLVFPYATGTEKLPEKKDKEPQSIADAGQPASGPASGIAVPEPEPEPGPGPGPEPEPELEPQRSTSEMASASVTAVAGSLTSQLEGGGDEDDDEDGGDGGERRLPVAVTEMAGSLTSQLDRRGPKKKKKVGG